MNYKFLSKYHYIYRLSFGGDKKSHVEKFPIAYSNQHYIYVIEPGSDELKKLFLVPTWKWGHGEVYTSVDSEVCDQIIKYISNQADRASNYRFVLRDFWFLIDDPEPLKEFANHISAVNLMKCYLLIEKEKKEKELSRIEENSKQTKSELAAINYKLSKLEE